MKLIYPTLLLLLGSVLFYNCSYDAAQPTSSIEVAESFIGTDYDSVIYYAEKYLSGTEENESKYYGHVVVGYAYLQKQQFIKATSHYLQANELIPENSKYQKDKSDILKTLGYIAKTILAHEHAIGYYHESLAVVSAEEKAGVLYNLGNVYKNMEEYGSATEQYLKSLEFAIKFKQSKRITKAKIQLGSVYSKQELFEQSSAEFDDILQQKHQTVAETYIARAYHYKANNEMRQGNYEDAIEFFSKSLSLKASITNQFASSLDMGDCYLKMNDPENALAVLQKAESLYTEAKPNPEYAEVFNLLAAAYEETGNTSLTTSTLRTYGAELKDFLQQKEEIIKLLNKQRFEQLVNSRAAYNNLWHQLTNHRNIGLMAGTATGILLLILAYKRYKSIQLKKAIARELNSI